MKVLLIEDNRDIADMVRLCLESENIICEATEDGKAGLQSIKEDKFDAIPLDLAIPEFSGFDIFRALKKDTSNLSHNYKKDDMIGMNQNANNISSSTKGDNTITTEKMSNMKGM